MKLQWSAWESLIRAVLLFLSVSMVAIVSGQFVWLLYPQSETVLPAPSVNSDNRTSRRIDLPSELLFGAAPVEAVKEIVEVKETTLSLTLKGVFPAEPMSESMAIISPKGGQDDVFRVGQQVIRGTTLAEVYEDRVILQRGGSAEILYFEKSDVNTLIADGSLPEPNTTERSSQEGSGVLPGSARQTYQQLSGSRQPVTGSSSGSPLIQDINSLSVNDFLTTYESKFQEDPQGVLESAGLKSTGDGYEVLSSSPLTGIGLRAGDKIVSVNGQSVGSIGNDMQLGNIIRSQRVARIEMQRGSRRFVVTYPIR